MKRPSPSPAPGRWLLKIGVPASRYDDISGDLDEVYRRTAAESGRVRAWVRHTVQCAVLSLRMLPHRLTGAMSDSSSPSRGRTRWFSWLDVKLGFRIAVRHPGLTLVAGLALAGGIGLSTAGFSVIYGALYSGLPIPNADRLVGVRTLQAGSDGYGRNTEFEYFRMRETLSSFERIEAFRTGSTSLGGEGVGNDFVQVAWVTPGSFSAVPVPPALGRVLHPDDARLGATRVVVLGHDLWQSRFGADPDVVGRIVRLGGVATEVVGVMPEGFAFPFSESAWMPLVFESRASTPEESPVLKIFGLLSENVPIEQANVELATLGTRLATDHPLVYEGTEAVAVPFQRLYFTRMAEPSFALLLGIVILALLVACANVANLILARAASRTNEIAVRAALGAARRRIVAQLFTEALVLSAIGAVVGVLGARFALRWASGVTLDLPFWMDFDLHAPTLLFVVAMTVLAAVVAGVAPGIRASGVDLQDSLKSSSAGGSGSLRFGRLSRTLVIAEVTLSVAFLAGAVLAGRTLVKYSGWDAGLPGDRILTARVQISVPPPSESSDSEESTGDRIERYHRAIRGEVARIPGVRAVTLTNRFPGELRRPSAMEIEDRSGGEDHRFIVVHTARVEPEYFEMLGVGPSQGRLFDRADLASSAHPVLVNEPFVRSFFGGVSPIGARIRTSLRALSDGDRVVITGGPPEWREIVGVVPDLGMSPGDTDRAAGVYSLARPGFSNSFSIGVRTDGDPHDWAQPLRDAVARVDPAIVVLETLTLDELGDAAISLFTAISMAFLTLATTTVFLSMAGLYALIAFSIARRTREIGIRTALGAGPRQLLGAVMSRSLRHLMIGLGVGGLVGYGVMKIVAAMPEPVRVQPGGPFMLAAVLVTIGILGAISCAIPASWALRIRTVDALRNDG